jgi:hypothetical protein
MYLQLLRLQLCSNCLPFSILKETAYCTGKSCVILKGYNLPCRRRRDEAAANLPEEVAKQVEVLRLGLLLHAYQTTTELTHPQGPDQPAVSLDTALCQPRMISAVRPPGGHEPGGKQGGRGMMGTAGRGGGGGVRLSAPAVVSQQAGGAATLTL